MIFLSESNKKWLRDAPIWVHSLIFLSIIDIITLAILTHISLLEEKFAKDFWIAIILLIFFAQSLLLWLDRNEFKRLRVRYRFAFRAYLILSTIGVFVCLYNLSSINALLVLSEAALIRVLNNVGQFVIVYGEPRIGGNGGEVAPSYIGWILAVLGLVIGFVVNLLYNIARDAKEQVENVKGIIDFEGKLKESKLNMLKVDLLVKFMLLDRKLQDNEPDQPIGDNSKAAHMLLAGIPVIVDNLHGLMSGSIELNTSFSDLQAKRDDFEKYRGFLGTGLVANFVRGQLADYIGELYDYLYHNRLSDRIQGEKFLSLISEIWAICKNKGDD